MVITLSFDNSFRLFDIARGGGFLLSRHPNRCRFTSCAWNERQQVRGAGTPMLLLRVCGMPVLLRVRGASMLLRMCNMPMLLHKCGARSRR